MTPNRIEDPPWSGSPGAFAVDVRLNTALHALRDARDKAAGNPEVQQRLDEAIALVTEIQNATNKKPPRAEGD